MHHTKRLAYEATLTEKEVPSYNSGVF